MTEVIRRSRRVILTTHENPDGDGLGAELALRAGLMQLGKTVSIINSDITPAEYAFLDRYGVIHGYLPAGHDQTIRRSDLLILLDAGELLRVGRVSDALQTFDGTTAVIDHHTGREWGDAWLVDASASSTTVLVRLVLREFSIRLSRTIAEALYVGILVDTMSFRNANTNADCLALAAECIGAGVNPAQLWQQVFGQWPLGRLQLEGDFLASLQTSPDGRLIWAAVDTETLERHRQKESAIEGFVERAIDVRRAEIAILFIEEAENRIRLSIRGKEPFAVDALARELGGGGHRLAAGATLDGSLGYVVPLVVGRAQEYLATARALATSI